MFNVYRMGGKIKKTNDGIPTTNMLPFGRSFDRTTGSWGLDENKKKAIEWVADQYIKGRSLRELSAIKRSGVSNSKI